MEIVLEDGFKKADSWNLPVITSEMLFSYLDGLIKSGVKDITKSISSNEYTVDFVHVQKGETCTIKAIVYVGEEITEDAKKVIVVICRKHSKIKSTECEGCEKGPSCDHIIEFLFWIHRQSNDRDNNYKVFWNIKSIEDNELDNEGILLRNVLPPTQVDEYEKSEDELIMITPEEGSNFLQLVLNEMEKIGLTDSALYLHCRPVVDEFEALYIHHIMLDNANNYIKDFKSFILYMEEFAQNGLFAKVAEVSSLNYKKKVWMETQYCRIRCSLMHSVLTRQYPAEDEIILEAIFCARRDERIEERKATKEHKRFILKQTEKLENKEYKECGLLLNETYPFICASPDGITDDHIVEIKVPKTEEEFEKYLVGKETIAPKYMAQMQIQMYLANVQKALYCVLSPKFEVNGAMHYVWVQAELQQVANLLSAAEDYWKEVVFPQIKKVYLED